MLPLWHCTYSSMRRQVVAWVPCRGAALCPRHLRPLYRALAAWHWPLPLHTFADTQTRPAFGSAEMQLP